MTGPAEEPRRENRFRRYLCHTPEGYRHSKGRVIVIYSGLMITMFIAALDQTIVATALPHIVADIGGISNYSWVFGSYLLFQTVTIPIYGRLGDMYGRRTMLLVAISIFIAGSVLCGVAQTMTELVVFRSIQGIGAGGMIPLVVATVGDIIPPRDRGRYQGAFGAVWGAASILGPAGGGLIVDHASWRWVFYVTVPVSVAALVLVALTMPRTTWLTGASLDVVGASLFTAGTSSLMLGLLWGGTTYPWRSVQVISAIAGAAVLFAAFGRWARGSSDSFLPFTPLRIRAVAVGGACVTLTAMCQFGTISFMPLFFQDVIGSSATSSGLVLTPLLLGIVLSSFVAGQVISRTGRYRTIVVVAPLALGSGMALLARLTVSSSRAYATHAMFLGGIGIGMITPVLMVAAQNAAPVSTLGATTAVMQFFRSLGTLLGTTAFGVIVNQDLPDAARTAGPGAAHLRLGERVELSHGLQHSFVFAVGLCCAILLLVLRGVAEQPLRRSVDEAALTCDAP